MQLININTCVSQNATQSAGRQRLPFMYRDSHTLSIILAPEMYVTASLSDLLETRTFKGMD